MFGMGWQEILLILVVAVLVIGPDQLPQVARTIGKLIAQFRRVTNDLRDTVNREFQDDENLKEFKEFQHSIDSEVRSLGYGVQDYVDKEVAKGEAELKALDEEVRANGGDPGTLTDPEPAPDWSHTVGDFPADAGAATETAQSTEAPAALEEAAAEPDGAAAPDAQPEDTAAGEEPVERSSTRRETA